MGNPLEFQSEHSIFLLLLLPWQQHNVRTGLYFWENLKEFIAVSAQSLCKGAIDSVVKIDCYQLYCPLQQKYFLINKCVGNMKNSCTAGGNSTTCTYYSYNVQIYRGLISAANIDFMYSSTERHNIRSELTTHTDTSLSPFLKVI